MNEHEWEEFRNGIEQCLARCKTVEEMILSPTARYEPSVVNQLVQVVRYYLPYVERFNSEHLNKILNILPEFNHLSYGFDDSALGALYMVYKDIYSEIEKNFMSTDVECKEKKLFISHSSEDKPSVELFVKLLKELGFKRGNMFCSSVIGFDILPGSGDIYEFLKNEFNANDLFVIYILSDNYYKSPACLNEMGASWVKSCNDQAILLPNFQYSKIDGAVSPRNIAFKLNDKYKLTEFKTNLETHFDLPKIEDVVWQRAQDEYLENLGKL